MQENILPFKTKINLHCTQKFSSHFVQKRKPFS